jgi:hypothetical protein
MAGAAASAATMAVVIISAVFIPFAPIFAFIGW